MKWWRVRGANMLLKRLQETDITDWKPGHELHAQPKIFDTVNDLILRTA